MNNEAWKVTLGRFISNFFNLTMFSSILRNQITHHTLSDIKANAKRNTNGITCHTDPYNLYSAIFYSYKILNIFWPAMTQNIKKKLFLPSKTAKNAHWDKDGLSRPIFAQCASSISIRQPCIVARPYLNPPPSENSVDFSVFGFSKKAPIENLMTGWMNEVIDKKKQQCPNLMPRMELRKCQFWIHEQR